MYDEILNNIKCQVSKEEIELIKKSSIHLGVFSEPCLSYMLEGKKTIESRFSQKKISPFNKIDDSAIVFVKESGGDVVAYFKILKVSFYYLDEYPISKIKDEFNDCLCCDDDFWILKSNSKYATLIFIKEIVKLEPFKINKKGMASWLVLKK